MRHVLLNWILSGQRTSWSNERALGGWGSGDAPGERPDLDACTQLGRRLVRWNSSLSTRGIAGQLTFKWLWSAKVFVLCFQKILQKNSRREIQANDIGTTLVIFAMGNKSMNSLDHFLYTCALTETIKLLLTEDKREGGGGKKGPAGAHSPQAGEDVLRHSP